MEDLQSLSSNHPGYSTMDWLKSLFTGRSREEIAEENKRRRISKAHGKRIRARERELRLALDGGGAQNARFFFGPLGETYDHRTRGRRSKEPITSGFMPR